MVHLFPLFFTGGGQSTARMASSNTVFRPRWVRAEHSRSSLVPTRMMGVLGQWCLTSGYHWATARTTHTREHVGVNGRFVAGTQHVVVQGGGQSHRADSKATFEPTESAQRRQRGCSRDRDMTTFRPKTPDLHVPQCNWIVCVYRALRGIWIIAETRAKKPRLSLIT
ncbi:hypothetical protein EYF80_040199 [Liparis tanakae]|uniref:Uncharacterized protein n=1 Tax=Liparis tanakae TaxID=230148 RepID=A0A4Z2G8J7_9TELE|nr:hypothetical protein EYF80_040199 [Liparis tanakae]